MDIDYKKLYLELFTTEMDHLIDLLAKYAETKDNLQVNDLKEYWERDGISPMITDSLEEMIQENDCPDEIKAQVEILRKFW